MGGASAFIDHADAIGSTTMETDPSGAAVWDVVNGPWGQAWQQTGTRQSAVFAGMDWQVNDPLMPSATREYSDGLGRWMTPDPGGTKVVSLANPQTWNMYAYVTDNPTTLNDPSGLSCYLNLTGCLKPGNNEKVSSSVANATHDSAPGVNSKHQQNVNNEAVGNTTVGNLSKVLTNEIGSLSTPKGGDHKELQNGANAIANALINNAHRTRPNEVAPDTGTASSSLAKIMQDAFTNRADGGADPVHGRTFYGTSHISPRRLHSRPIGNGRQTVYQHFGPFNDSYSGRTTWIYIYNDPGH